MDNNIVRFIFLLLHSHRALKSYARRGEALFLIVFPCHNWNFVARWDWES